ncbi:MAG: chloride channel protein [Leptolyngbyaceae cyanobacterium]
MAFPFLLTAFRSLLRPKPLAIFEAILIGLVAALAAVLLKQGVWFLGQWRLEEAHLLPVWLLLPGVGLLGGGLAGFLVERLAPEATGSGIPQVKAALAYVPIALDLRVAVVKLVSTMLTLSSGMALGRQGPTVQIGAALAAQLSRWVPASPDHQHQLIACGAAAGLAAGFDAPIAGVMFVIEELLQDVSSLTLGTAILAAFTGGVISRLLAGPNLMLGSNPLDVSDRFSLDQLPFLLLLGVLAGALAALFNRSILFSLQFSRRHISLSLPWKIGLAGLVTGLAAALLPVTFRDSSLLQTFLTLEQSDWQMILAIFGFQFLLTLVACAAEAPGGLFIPSLVLGAALGHLVGLGEQAVIGKDPVIFALTGMGAFFGAVAKVPVTAIVIVFEMTTNFNLVLPLMIASVTAYLVAELLAPGSLYTHLLELKGIQLQSQVMTEELWTRLTAADVMQQRVETLPSQMLLDGVMQTFGRSHHRGFPVVEAGRLVGIVTQTDLDKIGQRQLPATTQLKEIMTPYPLTVSPTDTLSQVLYLLSRYKVSRLPVVDRRQLVGIITRSDILRVESKLLGRPSEGLTPKPDPSYLVYRTCAPTTGTGRLLVPLSNPRTADGLLKLALAIAQSHNYAVECLQVMVVPRHSPPAETAVQTTKSRRLLNQCARQGETWGVPVHTQIRVAHSVAQAILETIQDCHIDLLVMGWKGSTSTPGRIFGDVVDTVIRQANCDVLLIKMGQSFLQRGDASSPPDQAVRTLLHLAHLERWLVPIAGGPNSQYGIQLLPDLIALSQRPEIRLCQVFPPDEQTYDTSLLEENAEFLRDRVSVPVMTIPVCARSVSEAVIDMAEKDQCDVIVLGASREGLLQQAIQGNIPEAIARHCSCTVMLVRKAMD